MVIKSNADRVAKTSGQSDPASVGAAAADLMTRDFRLQMKNIECPVMVFMPTSFAKDAAEKVEASYRLQFPGVKNLKLVPMSRSLHFLMFDEPEKFQKELTDYLSAIK